MKNLSILRFSIFSIIAICFYLPISSVNAANDVATVSITPSAIYWQPQVPYEQITLTVSGPQGVTSNVFPNGVSPSFQAVNLADGSYNYELTVTPVIDDTVKARLMAARESGDMSIVTDLRESGVLPTESLQQSGYFRIMNGNITVDTTPEG